MMWLASVIHKRKQVEKFLCLVGRIGISTTLLRLIERGKGNHLPFFANGGEVPEPHFLFWLLPEEENSLLEKCKFDIYFAK